MKIRESYVFDQPIGEFPGGHPRTFAVSADKRTYYAAFGVRAGITLLAHFMPDGNIAIGSWLHATTLRNVGKQGEAECVRDWLKRVADALKSERLVPMSEVPGFGIPAEGEDWTYHGGGWFSHGMWALPIRVPKFLGEDTTAWDIREGIYLAFPDGSCRLIARHDHGAAYRQWEDFVAIDGLSPLRRQGDVFVVSSGYSLEGMNAAVEVKVGATLDRHIVEDSHGGLRLVHPQHAPLDVSKRGDWLVMLPGVSHPFSRRGGIVGD